MFILLACMVMWLQQKKLLLGTLGALKFEIKDLSFNFFKLQSMFSFRILLGCTMSVTYEFFGNFSNCERYVVSVRWCDLDFFFQIC